MTFPTLSTIDATARASAAAAQATADAAVSREIVAWTFPAAASDTIQQTIPYPFDGAQVYAIQIAPNGAAGTGTLTALGGIAGAGNTLLNAASFDLSGLTGSTATELTLTATAADLQGDLGDYLQIAIANGSVQHEVLVQFGRQ